MPRVGVQSVFLSYAREDDADGFVRRLRDGLVAHGVAVWWDRASMESRGATFLSEIRQAIGEASRLVLVCSPAALESPYVRAEWEHARSEVVAITPVVRVVAADGFAASIPPSLASIHAIDATGPTPFAEVVAELTRLLEQPVSRSLLHRVPQPSVALARKEDDALRALVLAPSMSPVTLAPEERVVCVSGMGGIGKSTMVAACARSYEARFAVESVHWLTVGPDPRLPSLIDQLAADMGAVLPGGRSEESYLEVLSQLLARRRSLVVLDDLWSSEIAARFREAMGAQTTVVVTTRQAAIANDLNARGISPTLLDARRSRDVVTCWAGGMLIDDEDAARVLEQCGGLPYALALCGAMLRDGVAVASLMEALDNADLGFLERRFPDYPYSNLMAALHVSVEMLARDDPLSAELLGDLAVFAWPGSVPRRTIEAFWARRDLPKRVLDRSLTRLDQRGLVLMDRSTGHVTIHDLQRSYLRSGARNPAGLHQKFLAVHRRAQGWSRLEDDGYLVDHLALHLAAAGCADELHALIGREWLWRRFRETGSHRSFASDAEGALSAARAGEKLDVVAAFRAALARGAIASLAYDIDPRLLAVLVRAGQLEQAVAYISVMGTLNDRTEATTIIERTRTEAGRGPDSDDGGWTTKYRGGAAPHDEGPRLVHQAWERFDAGDLSQASELARRVVAGEHLAVDATYGPDALFDALTILHELKDADGIANAASMVGQLKDNTFRERALVPLLRALAEVGDPAIGLVLLRNDPYPPMRRHLSVGFAEQLSRAGRHDAALQVTGLLAQEQRWRTDNRSILDAELAVADALASLGAREASANVAKDALKAARGVEAETLGEHIRANGALAEALAQVGARLLDLGCHDEGCDTAFEAFSASRYDRAFGRVEKLYELLVSPLCRAGEHRLAAQFAEEFPAQWLVGKTYGSIARCLIEVGDLHEARRYATAAAAASQEDATQELVEVLLDLGEQQVALDLADRQSDPFDRCLAQARTGIWLARHGNRGLAVRLAERATQQRPSADPSPFNRLVPTVRVAQCFAAADAVESSKRLLEEAEVLIDSIVEARYRSEGWHVLAQGLASTGQPVREALLAALTSLTEDTDGPLERDLHTLAKQAIELGCPELVVDIVTAASAIENPLIRAGSLRQVVPLLNGPLAGQTLAALWRSTDDVNLPSRARVVIKYSVANGRHALGQTVDAIQAWTDSLTFAASTEITAVWHGLAEGAPMLGILLGPPVLTDLRDAMREVSSWWESE